MLTTLTQRLNADERQLKQLMALLLRLAGVLAAAILVFVTLYFFVASLEVPKIHRCSAREPAFILDESVALRQSEIASLCVNIVHR